MSTSLLYHAFGLRSYRYLRTEYLNGLSFFTVVMQPKKIHCPACKCRKVIRRETAER